MDKTFSSWYMLFVKIFVFCFSTLHNLVTRWCMNPEHSNINVNKELNWKNLNGLVIVLTLGKYIVKSMNLAVVYLIYLSFIPYVLDKIIDFIILSSVFNLFFNLTFDYFFHNKLHRNSFLACFNFKTSNLLTN